MCISGCSCLDVRLKVVLFQGSREVLHEGLVGVEAPDVVTPTIKIALPKTLLKAQEGAVSPSLIHSFSAPSPSETLLPLLPPMAATIPSSGLYASAFLTADNPLRRRLAASVAFPLHRRAASVTAVRATSSSKPASGAGARPARGITKPRPVSPAMQALVGVPEIPRTQALKLIWAYIKEHNLQVTPTFLFLAFPISFSSTSDTRFRSVYVSSVSNVILSLSCALPLQDPENKKIIVCDEKLKAIFGGRDRVGFLEISGLINPHFSK
ncbi:hypothetical protein B296_00036883 [Ensete ventricosum]|uniref:DM2 domain-containing protein n=1 Tax=Ensete ventricosum TaxID=4639 RepID=A0A426Z5R3_ENSVE|nr:hypothetical protein B296_00036883 [Ensete ventricosum]